MSGAAEKKKLFSRTRARRLVMQALYQWLVSGATSAGDIETQFVEGREMQGASRDYFCELFNGVVDSRDRLSNLLAPCVNRPLAETDPVEHAILLIAAYELKHVLSVPYRAVIHEAVELAKIYGAEGAYKFVNGVLDKLANGLRPVEKNG